MTSKRCSTVSSIFVALAMLFTAAAGCAGDREVSIAAPAPPSMQGALAKIPPTKVTLPMPEDRRPSNRKLGETKAAMGVPMGGNFATADVPEVVRQTIAGELGAAGHTVGDSGAPLRIAINVLTVTTDTTPLYWDIIGTADIEVTVGVTTRKYDARRTKREYVNPGAKQMSALLNGCLADLGKKFREDAVMAEAIRSAGH
jgi:uncharacterized lipoprotein YajG